MGGERGFDTAWEYSTQEAIGKAIRGSGVARSEIFISTKIQCSIHGGARAHGKVYPAHATRDGARAMIRDNLRLLGTDYIDLLLIHTPCDLLAPYPYNASAETSIVWGVLEEALANGTAKAIGVSQFRREHFEPLLKTARIVPAVNQYPMSVGNIDWDTVKYCRQRNITLQAFSPLHNAGCDGVAATSSPTLKRIATAHNMSIYQLMLRSLTQRGFAEVTATNKSSHAVSDLESFHFTLGDAELDTLDHCTGPKDYEDIIV